ncbi:MAG: hydroxyquinol 1,2-dioxygenase [Alphaproteobacteria bacterium]
MSAYTTDFGSIEDFRKGGVMAIDDDPKNYVFSNIFEVAANAAPYERVAVGKNFEYVIETIRAEGTSDWYTCAHDEFILAMDNPITVELMKLDDPDAVVDPESEGAVKISGEPAGRAMGWAKLGRGHMCILPVGSAYRVKSERPATAIFQTVEGKETVQRWAEICQIESIAQA